METTSQSHAEIFGRHCFNVGDRVKNIFDQKCGVVQEIRRYSEDDVLYVKYDCGLNMFEHDFNMVFENSP